MPADRANCDCLAAATTTTLVAGGVKPKAAKAVHKYVLAEQDHQAARMYAAGVRQALAGGAVGPQSQDLYRKSRQAAKWLHRAERHRAKSYSKVLKAGGCGCG